AAVRDRAEHRSMLDEINRLQRTATSDQRSAQRLQHRLDRTRNGLAYAVRRWGKLKRRTASLKTSLSSARASAKSSYSTGYNKGYSDASDALTTSAGSGTTGGCDSNYEGACVPTGYGDVNCADVNGTDFYVVGVDVDGLDGDGDGIACES